MKIVFVLLHYENLNETSACIDSLLKYRENSEIEIVVVDNGSVREPISLVKQSYLDKDYVHFVISSENLGFAKGNNLGFQYAKRNLNPEIIILSNSDVIYSQDEFIEQLVEDYNELLFDVAGPKIIRVEDGINQNPSPVIYSSKFDVLKKIMKFFILYFLSFFDMDLYMRRKPEKYEYSQNVGSDFQLHGACLIFGKNYIDSYDGLYDKTFMYGEESILKFIVNRDNLRMAYLDNISINHLEGVSVASVFGKGVKNRNFYYKWNMHSSYLLLKLMLDSSRK